MIKLIATDLDGTLLNDQHQLPDNFAQYMKIIADKNIIFVSASGRDYFSQAPVLDKFTKQIVFICNNGGTIVEDSKVVFQKTLEKSLVCDIIEQTDIGYSLCILCGENGTYCLPYAHDEEMKKSVEFAYKELTIVQNLSSIDDSFSKISFCCPNGAKPLFERISDKFGDDCGIVQTHDLYFDIQSSGISKGSALKFIQQKYNIRRDETIAFGNYFNDINMLESAKHQYIMANSPKEMFQYSFNKAPSNNDNGVIRTLKDLNIL